MQLVYELLLRSLERLTVQNTKKIVDQTFVLQVTIEPTIYDL